MPEGWVGEIEARLENLLGPPVPTTLAVCGTG